MMYKLLYIIKFSLAIIVLLCTSCEKEFFDDEEYVEKETSTASKQKGNVTVSILQLGQEPFQTEAKGRDIKLPNHLCFAIYDMGGARLKQANQTPDKIDSGIVSPDFGTVSLQLPAGTYQLVVLAHSSTKNPTMTNPAKIQFNNSIGYTDTYLYYNTLTVTDEPQTLDLSLKRIAALCRFVISDPIPDGVFQIKFEYKGGSGHLSALTGFGVTNSTQMVTRQVQPGQQYQAFDLYTFLHQQEGTIALTATALNAAGEDLYEWDFEIPMAQNQITWLTGNFFAEESDPDQWRFAPNITFDKRWDNEVFYIY